MRYRTLAPTALSAIALLVATALPGAAALPGVAAARGIASPTRTLVLELASPGSGAPAVTVPTASTLTAPQRAAEARRLLPSASVRADAEADARAAGLTVVSSNGSSVTVTGAADTVDALVGSDPASSSTPADWAGAVSGVIDASAGVGMWHSHSSFQTYDSLSASYGSGVPSALVPALTPATPIIASLQLSGWSSDVLTSAAKGVFVDSSYDPVASGQFTAVNAGRTPSYQSNDGEGDDEVALDQETLLAAAPQLKQRAYFAANSANGYAVGLQDIYNDVAAGLPIVAFTTSWGACETSDSVATRTAIDNTLAKLTALGVTLFAASGDNGTQDCYDLQGNPSTGVDFPASDPHVVGVGATTHSNGAAAPAPDTAWSEATSSNGSPGGSGGGSSTIFARPSYQDGVVTTAGRAVPDLAVDGDPNTGVHTIIEDEDSGEQDTVTSGGTSLSSPLAAAMIGEVAAARSARTGSAAGFGDIHSLLYSHPEAFTDVVATTTAYNEGSGPTAFASPGYDMASGLGTPKIDVLSTLLNTTPAAPVAVAVAAVVLNQAPTVTITSWSRPSATKATGVLRWKVTGGTVAATGFGILVGAGGKTTVRILGSGSRTTSFSLPAGLASVQLIMESSAGSSMDTSTLGVPTDDRKLVKGWTAVADRRAFLGTLSVTGVAGRRATLTATGSAFRITVRTGVTGGLATVLLDGKKVGTIDTYSSRTTENVTKLFRPKKKGKHTLTLVVSGRHDAHAHGDTVALDAMSAA